MPDDLPTRLAAARSLTPAVAARAEEMDRLGRVPADLSADLAEAGLLMMLAPASLGGAEAHPVDAIDAIAELATVNPSAGWAAMISSTTSMLGGFLPPDGAAEVFADRAGCWGGAYAPSGTAEVVDGGYRLSGRWAWGSGGDNCTWFVGGAVTSDGRFRSCFVPASDVTIHPNWDVVGLRGTGSHDWSVADVVVPERRTVSLVDGPPVAPGALYRLPLFGMLASGIAAVGIGIAQGAVDALVELAGGKVPSLQTRRLAERSAVQAEVGRRTAQLRAARALLRTSLADAHAAAERHEPLDDAARAAVRLAATHAAHESLAVTSSMFTLAGGTSVRNDSPLARLIRDAHVVTQHLMVSPTTWEPCGKTVLGLALAPAEL